MLQKHQAILWRAQKWRRKIRQPGNSQNVVPGQQLKGNICSVLKELEGMKAFLAISPF